MLRGVSKDRKVAVYGRVSSENEAQLSAFENQVLWYDKQVEKHPEWEVIDRYFDKGITGTQAKKRVRFLKMIADANDGLFDLIITREVSRFARNTLETLQYTRELKSLGVEVYFMEDGISTFDKDGEIRLTNMAAHAQDESRKLSERIKAGQYIARHEKGVIYGSGNILGYNRRKDNGLFVIDEEQAATVKMMYKLYLEGKGIRAIKVELTKEGRKNSVGQVKWHETTISRVLANPFYTGRQYQQQSTVVDYLNQERTNNDREDYVMIQGSHEPLITIEDFEKAVAIRGKRSLYGTKAAAYKPTNDKWMKILECGCGAKFQQHKWRKSKKTGEIAKGYSCRNRVVNHTTEFRLENGLPLDGVCDRKSISDWHMELMVKDILKEIWGFRKETVIKAFEIIKDSFIDDEVDNRKIVQGLKSTIEKNKDKISRLIDLYTDAIIDKKEFNEKREQYSNIMKTSEEELKNIDGGSELAEKRLDDKLKSIRETLEQLINFEQERISDDIINQLVDKIIVRDENEYEWFLNISSSEIENVFNFNLNEKYGVKRDKSINIRDTKYNLVFKAVIDANRAREYRRKYGKHIKISKWENMEYKVYVR